MNDELDVNDLLHTMIADDITGQRSNVQLHAPDHKRQAYLNAAEATKQFHQVVNSPRVSYDDVQSALKKRISAATNFENTFGVKWPL